MDAHEDLIECRFRKGRCIRQKPLGPGWFTDSVGWKQRLTSAGVMWDWLENLQNNTISTILTFFLASIARSKRFIEFRLADDALGS